MCVIVFLHSNNFYDAFALSDFLSNASLCDSTVFFPSYFASVLLICFFPCADRGISTLSYLFVCLYVCFTTNIPLFFSFQYRSSFFSRHIEWRMRRKKRKNNITLIEGSSKIKSKIGIAKLEPVHPGNVFSLFRHFHICTVDSNFFISLNHSRVFSLCLSLCAPFCTFKSHRLLFIVVLNHFPLRKIYIFCCWNIHTYLRRKTRKREKKIIHNA